MMFSYFAQKYIGIPNGTIKATVYWKRFTLRLKWMKFLYELKDHSAGLNCGRWDYIFSFLKGFRNHNEFLLPDRAQVTMTAPFYARVFFESHSNVSSS